MKDQPTKATELGNKLGRDCPHPAACGRSLGAACDATRWEEVH